MNSQVLLTSPPLIYRFQGFILWRHESNEATCIEYKDAKGNQKIIAVKDAKFRSVQKFGTTGLDVPELTNFTSSGTKGWYTEGNPVSSSIPIPNIYTNEAVYQN